MQRLLIDAGYRVGGHIPTPLKTTLAKALLLLLNACKALSSFARTVWSAFEPVTGPLARALFKGVVIPIYKVGIFAKLRLSSVMSSARGFFFLLFTNKFVLHFVLLTISLSTIALQLQTNNAAAADAGQNSILYALVSPGDEETVQEEVRAEAPTKAVSYLGNETIQAVPDIDFDYDSDALADLTVPGSIAQQPGTQPVEVVEEPVPEGDVVVARTKTEVYTVRSGDSVALIARRFGVTVTTIIQANQLTKQASIKPGDTLKIPPVSGILHTVKKGDTVAKLAKTYQADTTKIVSANQLEGRALTVGEEIVIPDGVPVPVAVKPPVALRPGVTPTKSPLKAYDPYQELAGARVDVRIKPPDINVENIPQEKMAWPTTQRVITQYYSALRHTGIDIDGDFADSIIASAAGRVVEAGWNSSGYGLQIVIDHLDGRKTRYAHSSKLFVKVGDVVKKGQVIAMVGTTGRSTGTHLHFEVYVNGKRRNPLAYIK